MAKQASIELKNLTKEYVTHEGTGTFLAVDYINVNIGSGVFVTLLGPSGCGKTTTLRMIAGFESVSGGDILLDGIRINEMTPDKRDSSMVFQSYALFPNMTVFQNIEAGIQGKKAAKRERAMEMMEKFHLSELASGYPARLSGGQQQRLCIARALAVNPEVILMDEPTSALDPISTSKIEDLVIELKKQYTIIMVTHNMQQAVRVSDKTVFFLLGEVIESGETERLFSVPQDKRTEDYITGRFG